ncbi:MAG: RidA family protein [Thermoguttaceae bacterium]
MTRLMTIRHHGPMHDRKICDGEATAITTAGTTEIFARCAPVASGTSKNGCRRQTQVIYESLGQLLEEAGAGLDHVVIEKAYFRNLVADFDDFEQIRHEAYRRRGVIGERLPATTYLQQPPCRAGQDIELQAYAVVPDAEGRTRVTSLPTPYERVGMKLLQVGQARHLYISNISGYEADGGRPVDFRKQSDRMFDQALQMLGDLGTTFPDVVRTWIYLSDIDRDYGTLNASRNDFFDRENVNRLPASTGIGGGLYPGDSQCTFDLYTLLNPEIADIEIMTTPTLNEAAEYGASFSRGMRMTLPEQTYLFISGTASVDEAGATVHVGDARLQIERMLLNIRELLRPHGANWTDLAHAVTYLKSADYLPTYREILAKWGVSSMPHTIVEANVCRPELLCEMEAIAVIPNEK